MNRPIYKLADWIDIKNLYWDNLSENPNAIDLLMDNQDKINWKILSKNPNAIDLLMENQDKIDWDNLSENPNAIDLLIKNQDKINWKNLSKNPNAIDLLKENQDKINWFNLSKNPNAIDLLKENQDKISWCSFSCNPNSIDFLKENIDYIDEDCIANNPNAYEILCNLSEFNEYEALANSNRKIIELTLSKMGKFENNQIIHENIDEDDIHYLCFSSAAIDILEKHQDKINNWRFLSENPSIFKLDYQKMKEKFEPFYLDIIKEVMRPDRMLKNLNMFGYDVEDMFD